MKVAVVGLRKLAAPLAAVLASKGNEMLGIDVNPATVQRRNDGPAPGDEPRLQDVVSASRASLTATTDIVAAANEVIIFSSRPALERWPFVNDDLLAAVEEIGPGVGGRDEDKVVVVASTVMPGSCDAEIQAALERTSGPAFADLPLQSIDCQRAPLVVIDCWGLLSDERDDGTVDIVRLAETRAIESSMSLLPRR